MALDLNTPPKRRKGILRKMEPHWDSVSKKISKSIKRLKSEYKRNQNPIKFCFRNACNQWVKRSDKYTHLIHKYPAKLLPYIPIFFLFDPEFKDRSDYLLDPFAGTGTVLLESLIHPYHRMNALGIEINPLARLISKVKTTPLNTSILKQKSEALISHIKKSSNRAIIENFPNIDLWFTQKAQRELSKIRYQIDCLEDSKYKDFFRVCFSSIIRRTSLADPKVAPPVILKPIEYSDEKQTAKVLQQIKEKQNPEPIKYFEESIKKNTIRMEEFCKVYNDPSIECDIIWDDSRTLQKGKYKFNGTIDKTKSTTLSRIDLVITSPPYINAQKYVRTLKFELLWLGILTYKEIIELDKQYVGTEKIYKIEYQELIQIGEPYADDTINKIYKKDKRRAAIVGRYYQDMILSMKKIYDSMNNGGRFVLVVGNNMVRNKRILNHQILANLAVEHIGFILEFIACDEILSRGLITKRHETSDIISDEWIIVLKKE